MEKGETVDFCHFFITKLTLDELIFVKCEKQRKIGKGSMIGWMYLNIYSLQRILSKIYNNKKLGKIFPTDMTKH